MGRGEVEPCFAFFCEEFHDCGRRAPDMSREVTLRGTAGRAVGPGQSKETGMPDAKTILVIDDDPDVVEATRAILEGQGYTVEGSISLKSLEALGFPPLSSGRQIRVGIFRAEFSRGEGPKPIENWISWVDPCTKEPDFHVPSSLGRFRMVK